MIIREIYCPHCNAKGRIKKLARTDITSRGTIYLWCKCCKKEVEIKLNKYEPESR